MSALEDFLHFIFEAANKYFGWDQYEVYKQKRDAAKAEISKLEADYTAAIKANVEVGKLNADLQEENYELKRKLEQAQKIAIYYSELPYGVRPSLYSQNLLRIYKEEV